MSFWDFLSSLDDSTMVIVLILVLVARMATLSTVIVVLFRVTTFLLSFARLPKKKRRSTLDLLKRLPKSLGR